MCSGVSVLNTAIKTPPAFLNTKNFIFDMSIKRLGIFLCQYLCGRVCVCVYSYTHMHVSSFSQAFTVETGHLYLCV